MKKIPFEEMHQDRKGKEPEIRLAALLRKIRQALSRIKTDKDVQKRSLAALLAVCIGVGLGEASRRYGIQKALEAEAAMYALRAEEMPLETSAVEEETDSPKDTPPATEETETEPEEKAYEPSPDRLNLAYFFPEDSDGEEIIDSYAGQVFQELTIRDSEWLADIYELADIRPVAMAARLGRSSASAMGKYDPKNDAHDPNDPSTWAIDNWKSIHVSFVDGDGRTSASYSNVKEILAMASVYTYHKDMMDVEAFRAYAIQLWEDSHRYTLSMGDVYYCDGCIDKTDEEIAREAIEEEEAAASVLAAQEDGNDADPEEGQAGADGDSRQSGSSPSKTARSGDAQKSDSPSASSGASGEGSDRSGSGTSGGDSGDVSAESGRQADGSLEASLTDGASSQETSDGTGQGAGGNAEGQVTVIRRTKKKTTEGTEQADGEAAVSTVAEPVVQEVLEQPKVIRRTKKDLETAESLEGTELASDADAQPEGLSGEGAAVPDLQDGAGGAGEGQETVEDLDGSSDSRGSDSGRSSRSGSAERRRSDCPGHVDLYIRVNLLGLEGKNSLIAKDRIGNAAGSASAGEEPEDGASDSWEGWTEEDIAHVKAICEQDWFADYGLSISSISLSTPLSNAEIEGYMQQLPEDLSETRKAIVRFALSSVGRVPYYWGGKASRPGYEGNNFGVLVPSDDKGRILKGLDCSGWISWVYWSVMGDRLEGSSTSGLILCGKKISRSELKPGDIIVRTGANAHVVMFLSWSANGQMNVIHESSASVNNVTIKTMDAAWPYYRRLVD